MEREKKKIEKGVSSVWKLFPLGTQTRKYLSFKKALQQYGNQYDF